MPTIVQPMEAIKIGWKYFMENPVFFAVTTLIVVLVGNDYKEMVNLSPGMMSLLSLIQTIISVILGVSLIKIYLKYVRGDKNLEYGDLFIGVRDLKLLFMFILTQAIYVIIVLLGLILLIVPGIYFAIKYSFATVLVLDRKVGPFEALKMSGKMTDGVKMDLLVYALLAFGVMALGTFALLVGLLAAIPVVYLASAYIYLNLLKRIENGSDTQQPEGKIEEPVIA